jgi:hypothetical protein
MSLGFWGRLVLRVFKAKTKPRYGEPLTVAAGLALLLFMAQLLGPYLENYRILIKIYFFTGLFCAIIEIILCLRKYKLNKIIKIKVLKEIILSNNALIVSVILSLAVSLLYASIWPSGKIEHWMNNGIDFYIWILNADYHLANLDVQKLTITPQFYKLAYDSMGTSLIIALMAVANAKNAFASAPYCVITLLTWLGAFIYYILNKKFNFNYKYSIILTFGMLTGQLTNYLMIFGQFGHAIFILMFLGVVCQLDSKEYNLYTIKSVCGNIYIQLVVVFVSYQSGYILFCLFIGFYIFLISFINSNNIYIAKRLVISVKLGIIPVVAATLVSAILMPGLAHHVVERTGEVANQTVGWELPYLAPWLFSGFPFLPTHELLAKVHVIPTLIEKFIYYPVYIIVFTVITLYVVYESRKKIIYTLKTPVFNCGFGHESIEYIILLSFTYLSVLIIYYIAYLLFGNVYRIWKFATYTALPLSFLPTSLVLLVLSLPLDGNRSKAVAPVATLLAGLVFLGGFLLLPPLVQLPITFYSVYSAVPFFSEIYRIKPVLEKYQTIVVDINEHSKYFMLISLLNNLQVSNIKYTNSLYYIYGSSDYFKLINNNSILVSSRSYSDIYNGSLVKDTHRNLYVYNIDKLQELGYVALNSLNSIFRSQFENKLTIKIRIPNKYRDIDLINEINLGIIGGPVEICRKVQIGYSDKFDNIHFYMQDMDNLYFKISFLTVKNMIIDVIILTPQHIGCRYSVKSIILHPF